MTALNELIIHRSVTLGGPGGGGGKLPAYYAASRTIVKQRNRPEASTVSADCSHVFGKWKGISVTSYGR